MDQDQRRKRQAFLASARRSAERRARTLKETAIREPAEMPLDVVSQTDAVSQWPQERREGRLRACAEMTQLLANLLGQWVAMVVWGIVFLGVVDATGAPPGGVLSGLFGEVLSFLVHVVAGVFLGASSALSWLPPILIGCGVIGTVRRRGCWYAAPCGGVAVVGVAAIQSVVERGHAWLGSVNLAMDAALFWAATVWAWLMVASIVPLEVLGIWKWTNGRKLGDLSGRSYRDRLGSARLSMQRRIVGDGRGMEALVVLGIAYVGGEHWGLLGAIGGLLVAIWFRPMLSVIALLLSGAILGVGLFLPSAALLAIWGSGEVQD